jgi:hypothetical protein
MTLNDLYLTNKIGYATMVDSIVAALFQNILPAAYSRSPDSSSHSSTQSGGADLQSQVELPGMPTIEK